MNGSNIIFFLGRLSIIVLAVFYGSACQPTPSTPPRGNDITIIGTHAESSSNDVIAAHRRITDLSDRILLKLATKNYAALPDITLNADTLTGTDIAYQLLGPYAPTAVLEHWDAGQMTVEFNTALDDAVANVVLTYRIKPNHKAVQTTLSFYFIKTNNRGWMLSLQPR